MCRDVTTGAAASTDTCSHRLRDARQSMVDGLDGSARTIVPWRRVTRLGMTAMQPWVWFLVGSGSGVVTTIAALVRYRMTLTFYREMDARHGVKGLEAAARAVHPLVDAMRARRRAREPRRSRSVVDP